MKRLLTRSHHHQFGWIKGRGTPRPYTRLLAYGAVCVMLVLLFTSGIQAQQTTVTSTPTPTPTATGTVRPPLATEEAEVTEEPEPFVGRATIDVESAFVRREPDLEAEEAASVFEDDVLEVVGRNIDGTWFEVRRPGRIFNLGWISTEVLDWDFQSERLALTDGETGLEGEAAIEDTGFAVFLTAEATLRDAPFVSGGRITLIPLGATVPVLGRDQEGTWLQVNYRGYEGWISNATFRRPDNWNAIPEVVVEGVPVISAPIIPPEIQLAQLEAFRTYVLNSRDVSIGLRDFWWNVSQGEVMPCEPPPFVNDYLYTPHDVRELPELDRYAPRFNQGIDLLNAAIDPLTTCGILQRRIANDARNASINAAVIFDATLGQLDNLELIITGEEETGG